MLRHYLASLLIILFLTFLASCKVMPTEKVSKESAVDKAGEGEKSQSMNIPCFQCHSYERFRDPKIFPHDMHRDMGLHCTQCHVLKAHASNVLNRETCTSCHNLSLIKLSLSTMPAVFNHERHARLFGCNDCHLKLFRMKANSVKITMDEIFKGEFCGKCHNGKMAFAATDCGKCHK
jgi:c(7)-type cytochrome triheme protein